ncbi:unnamed protein product, partial [Owenia fusiformis]
RRQRGIAIAQHLYKNDNFEIRTSTINPLFVVGKVTRKLQSITIKNFDSITIDSKRLITFSKSILSDARKNVSSNLDSTETNRSNIDDEDSTAWKQSAAKSMPTQRKRGIRWKYGTFTRARMHTHIYESLHQTRLSPTITSRTITHSQNIQSKPTNDTPTKPTKYPLTKQSKPKPIE